MSVLKAAAMSRHKPFAMKNILKNHVVAAFSLLVGLFCVTGALAQPPAASTPKPGNAPDPAVQTVRETIVDLGLLQSLTPLKLTAGQIDKILPLLRAGSQTAVKLRAQDDEALKALGADLAKARDAAIGGTNIPDAIEKKILDASKASDDRSAAARKETIATLLPVLKSELTDAQKAEIEKQSEKFFGGKRVPRQYANDPSKAPHDVVQDLALVAYIERVLLFDRTVTLLEKMKSAAPSAPAGG